MAKIPTGTPAARTLTAWPEFWLFSYLQLLDLLSTLAFLAVGVQEANPVVRYALTTASHPLVGLTIVKALALGFGFACLYSGRQTLLRRANIGYALLIVWNLFCLLLGVAQLP